MSSRAELEAGLRRILPTWKNYKEIADKESLPVLNPTAPGTTDEDRLDCNIKHLLEKADKFPDVWHKKLCRLSGLSTTDERAVEFGERSTEAAERAVNVAEEGNTIARAANRLSCWAIVIALIATGLAALAWLVPRNPP